MKYVQIYGIELGAEFERIDHITFQIGKHDNLLFSNADYIPFIIGHVKYVKDHGEEEQNVQDDSKQEQPALHSTSTVSLCRLGWWPWQVPVWARRQQELEMDSETFHDSLKRDEHVAYLEASLMILEDASVSREQLSADPTLLLSGLSIECNGPKLDITIRVQSSDYLKCNNINSVSGIGDGRADHIMRLQDSKSKPLFPFSTDKTPLFLNTWHQPYHLDHPILHPYKTSE